MLASLSLLLSPPLPSFQAEIGLDDDTSMEVVGKEEGETQFHIDMEQEQIAMPAATPSTVTHDGSHGNMTTPVDDGCRGEEATHPHLGPSYSTHQVMRNSMSESLDIQMRVLQGYIHSTCFQRGRW